MTNYSDMFLDGGNSQHTKSILIFFLKEMTMEELLVGLILTLAEMTKK